MDVREYIRKTADKYGWIKYYSVLRPVSIGTQPTKGFVDFINFTERTEIDGKMVWSELYYNRELDDKELSMYELIKA